MGVFQYLDNKLYTKHRNYISHSINKHAKYNKNKNNKRVVYRIIAMLDLVYMLSMYSRADQSLFLSFPM